MIFAAIDVLTLAHAYGFRFFRLTERVSWFPPKVFAALLWIYFPEDFALASVLNIAKGHVQPSFGNSITTVQEPRDQDADIAEPLRPVHFQAMLVGEPRCDDVALTLIEFAQNFRNLDVFSRYEDKSVAELFERDR